ncbi:MAG: hypothetical protein ACREP7_02995 [Lysobacter sp.]
MQTANGGPAGTGPSIANQSVTMRRNTDNPTGNTFVAHLPAITVNYSLSNQQYTTNTGSPTNTGVLFGGNVATGSTAPAAFALYGPMNAIGGGTSNQFTSTGAAAGTGMDVALNGAVALFVSASTLARQPAASRPATNARVRMADVTLTFSRPVTNPVIHFSGMGGSASSGGTTQGLTGEYDLLTTGLTMTRLSGNTAFAVSATSINNQAANPSTSCAANQAACGSVRLNGQNIVAVAFRVFLRGDGGSTTWDSANTTGHAGDTLTISASLEPRPQIRLQKALTNNRVAANDQFVLNIAGPRGGTATAATATTTGAGNSASGTADFSPGDVSGVYTLSETMAAGSTSALSRYVSTIACSNAKTDSTTVLPTGTGTSFNLTAGVSDDITCTFSNRAATAALSIRKADGSNTYTPGGAATYALRACNATGADAGSGAVIADTLPAGVTLSAPWTCTGSGSATCSAGSGGTVGGNQVSLIATALPAGGCLDVSVPVSFSSNPANY